MEGKGEIPDDCMWAGRGHTLLTPPQPLLNHHRHRHASRLITGVGGRPLLVPLQQCGYTSGGPGQAQQQRCALHKQAETPQAKH